MQSERFAELVEQLTLVAEKKPQVYRRRVFALAVLGCAYIGFVLFTILSLVFFFIFILVENLTSTFVLLKTLVITNILFFFILKALWVRFPEPQGKILTLQQVPRLFEILDYLKNCLRTPTIHTVLLTNDLNANIIQIPQLSVFSWQKNYLVIGMPLLQALSVEQLMAILAHEYSHLSGAYGGWNARIYRLRQTWNRLISALHENKNWKSNLFYRFFEWYVPFFNAYSFVLARQQELEADKYSSQINGPSHIAQALVTIEIKARFLEERFWKKLYQLADNTEEPLHQPYRLLQKILPQTYDKALTPKEKQQWLAAALSRPANVHDTHPPLKDRLRALGETAHFPTPISNNAASYCFCESLEEVLDELNHAWKEKIAPQWLKRFNYVQQAKQKLKVLQEKAKTETLDISECWERAELVRECYGNEPALPFYQLIVKKEPTHALAYFVIGTILCEKQNPQAPNFLKKSMEYDSNLIVAACQQLYLFYQKQQQFETAQFYLERAQAHAQEEHLAILERSQLNNKDTFKEHHLDQATIHDLLEQLKSDKTIKRLYLVQKKLQHLPNNPLYILGIVRIMGLRLLSNAKYIENLQKTIKLPISILLVALDDYLILKRKIKKVPHALIYEKHVIWWAKGWIWLLFLLGILVIFFSFQDKEETSVSSPLTLPKPIIVFPVVSQDNLMTLEQQQVQFKLNHVAFYDQRLVEGLKLAFETYPTMLAEMPTPKVESTFQQLNDEQFEINFQIIFPHRKPLNYQLILSNQPEQVLNNFQAILTTFAQFKTIFQPRQFPHTVTETTLKQLNEGIFYFDTFEYLKQLQFIEQQILNRKESPTILLSASEMFGWLSFFNNHQQNTTLADKLAVQSLSHLLMGNHFSTDSSYQQGLLLLALDYPNAALSLLTRKNGHLLSQLLSAFIRQDVAFLQKVSEEKAAYHQISWYLIMRTYKNMQAIGWTSFFMQRLLEKYPAFLAAKNYITAQGKVELIRVLVYPYLAEIFLQHLKIAEYFLKMSLSEKKQDLIRYPHYKIETDDWVTFYRQLLEQKTQPPSLQLSSIITIQLLRELLTEEVLNALIVAYELAADQLADLGRAENVLTAIETVFSKTSVFQALQLYQKTKRELLVDMNSYLTSFSPNEPSTFLLKKILSIYALSADYAQVRPTIFSVLNQYRQLQHPNVQGYVQLSQIYEQFYYYPQARDYLQNASKLDPFQSSYKTKAFEFKPIIPFDVANHEVAYSLTEQKEILLTPEQRCIAHLAIAKEKINLHIEDAINHLLMCIETHTIYQTEYDLALQWLKQFKESIQQSKK